MKQTAVEFAFEELNKWRIENFGQEALIGIPQEVLDKAKEMEKQRIKKAYEVGITRGMNYDEEIYHENNWGSSEQYYNKVFKSE